MRRMIKILGRLQQCLGGNAAHVGASAAGRGLARRRLPFIDARDLHAQLRRADGGDIAAGAGADDYYVELFTHC